MKSRLALGLAGAAALTSMVVVLGRPLGAAERATVEGLGLECDVDKGTFVLRLENVGVFLRGSLPSVAVGDSNPLRPGEGYVGQAESVRTDTGGQRLTLTYAPQQPPAGPPPGLVYAFEISGDGVQVTLSAEVVGAEQPLRSQLAADVSLGTDGFACRLAPGEHPEVVQTALGQVSSRLCDSLFDKRTDTAVTFAAPTANGSAGQVNIAVAQGEAGGYALTVVSRSGQAGPVEACAVKVTRDYYQRVLGIERYAPIDKSVFKTPPNGWCSWYYYYGSISEEEMVSNTDWLARNLKPFGLEYVQLDDGYQTESWTRWDARFPHGGKWLVDYIHSKGLKAGLWLTPFSQGEQALVEQHPQWFLRDAEGKVVQTFKGPFTVDASNPEVLSGWFEPLCQTLGRDWGFDYFKIDGQPDVIGAYRRNRERLADPSLDPAAAYRQGLAKIREMIGPNAYLLGCWGIPLEGIGLMNGSRTGGDVGVGWGGFQTALGTTMEWYFLHNIAWYCDPDCISVREPLSLDQATAWATLMGITGQHLMTSDNMPALPEERVELLRRIYPAADIRPLDLYRYEGRPRIWDLKIAQGGEQCDIVAVFNWDQEPRTVNVDYAALGLDPDVRYAVYDFWHQQLVGVLPVGFSAWLRPTSASLYAVKPVADHPTLLSTSRHVTQGALDLREVRWSQRGDEVTGTSQVVGGDPYTITIFLPPFPSKWSLESAAAEGVQVQTKAEHLLAQVTLSSPHSGLVDWRLTFASTPGKEPSPAAAPTGLRAEATTMRDVRLAWNEAEQAIGYYVYRNDQRLALVTQPRFDDRALQPDTGYTYRIAAASWDGSASQLTEPVTVRTQAPPPRPPQPDVYITELEPRLAEQGWGRLQSDRSVERNALSIGGEQLAHGLGSHAAGRIVYDLDGTYSRFVALIGVDDERAGQGSVVFQVYLDAQKVFDSGVVKGGQPPLGVDVPLGKAKRLSLVMTDAGDGINSDHADWAEAGFIK